MNPSQRPLSRLLAGGLLLATAGLAGPARAGADRSQPPSCHAGRTVYRHAGIRAFVIVRKFGKGEQEGASVKTFYVCSPTLRKAHAFDRSDPFTSEGLFDYRLFGDRLGFLTSSQGVQNGASEGVGWVNLVTGRAKLGGVYETEQLSNEEEEDPRLPKVPPDRVNYAIAGDGTVAVLGEGGEPLEWEVALLAVKPRALAAPRRLLRVKAPQEGLDVSSLAITDTSVTWATKHGLPSFAPR